MQHVLISANKGVVSLFLPPSFVSECLGRREVLAFCAAFVWWLTEWSPGKPEWAGGAASGIAVFPSLVFTFCLFAEQESWTPLSLYCTVAISSCSFHRFVLHPRYFG